MGLFQASMGLASFHGLGGLQWACLRLQWALQVSVNLVGFNGPALGFSGFNRPSGL